MFDFKKMVPNFRKMHEDLFLEVISKLFCFLGIISKLFVGCYIKKRSS